MWILVRFYCRPYFSFCCILYFVIFCVSKSCFECHLYPESLCCYISSLGWQCLLFHSVFFFVLIRVIWFVFSPECRSPPNPKKKESSTIIYATMPPPQQLQDFHPYICVYSITQRIWNFVETYYMCYSLHSASSSWCLYKRYNHMSWSGWLSLRLDMYGMACEA